MSRIGKMAITIPAGVEVEIAENNVVTVKNSKGTMTQALSPKMVIEKNGQTVTVSRPDNSHESKSLHGLTRTLLNNMIVGLDKGFTKELEVNGVGYRAALEGKKLVLNLGHSHPIYFEEANGITFEIPDNTTIIVKGYDKQAVGQIAAVIRSKRPPEPYLGKGVKYSGEKIRRKAGKTGK